MSDDDRGLQAIVEALDLDQIYVIHLAGSRTSGGDMAAYEFELEPKLRRNATHLDFLFEAKCRVTDSEGEEVASLATAVVTAFSSSSSLKGFDQDVVEEFGHGVALFAAYPYIRETIQGLAAKLGIVGLTLDIVKRGGSLPFTLAE